MRRGSTVCLFSPPRIHTMMRKLPFGFLSSQRVRKSQRRRGSRLLRLQLERLEDRSLLATIAGAVSVGGLGFAGAQVSVYAAGGDHATLQGQGTADGQGNFNIEYDDAAEG